MLKKKRMVVLVSGLVGAGKSVLCEKIAKHYKLKYLPTSGLLRAIIEKELLKQKVAVTKNTGFWESADGKRFQKERLKNQRFDKEVDAKLRKLIEKGGIVLDSWEMPWISKKGYKIWLTASDKTRFRRVAGRDKKSVKEARKEILQKEAKSVEIHKKLYGFTWGKDLTVFDLIIDTDGLTEQEVFEKAREAIEKDLKQK